MKKSTKKILMVAGFAVAAGAVAVPVAVTAWGDNSGGRASYTIDQINNGALGDTIVLDSISDNPNIGDEKNFVGARDASTGNNGADNVWNGNEIDVEDGKEYLVRIYVHNNNPNGTDAVAKDVTVSYQIPNSSSKTIEINGFINSSNATPSRYWDYVRMNADTNFHLEYVQGSALLENNGVGANGGVKLSDSVVGSNVTIGYDALDGNIPGCFQYASYVTIKVKVVYDYEFDVQKTVRLADTKDDWVENLSANIGDEVEFQIAYKNNESTTVSDVMVKDVLPDNLEYVEGSTVIYNAAHPSGATYNNGDIVTTGNNIGGYTAGSNAYIRFRAKVVDDNLSCGENTITNWGQIGTGQTTKQDSAAITVVKTCDEPEPDPTPTPTPDTPDEPDTPSATTTTSTPSELPTTGPATIALSSVVGLGALTTAGGLYVASRKQLH